MRIVAGKHRGRTLRAPEGRDVRPTSDRARQTLFDMLSHRKFGEANFEFEGVRVADVFCGTGALGLEALSRGAEHAVFIDIDRKAIEAARENAKSLGEEAHATFLQIDATRPPRCDAPCALLFLDPPYRSGLAGKALAALAEMHWLAPGAIATVEIGAKEDLVPPGGFETVTERKVGAAKIAILRYGGA